MFRKSLIAQEALLRRLVITLKNNEGVFSGVLTSADKELFIFEDCRTVPKTPDGVPDPIPGRAFVERNAVLYLQDGNRWTE